MEETLPHLLSMKPCWTWDILHINWWSPDFWTINSTVIKQAISRGGIVGDELVPRSWYITKVQGYTTKVQGYTTKVQGYVGIPAATNLHGC